MKCIIAGISVKVLGKAVHSLSKIGDELYIDALDDGLAFRTVNSSRSAYATFTFANPFFELFQPTGSKDNEDSYKFKISMKSCLTVFKSLSTLEKTIEKCIISVNSNGSKLVFQLFHKYGITKTFYLPFIECSSIQAIFSREKCSNFISVNPKLLTETLLNFQANQDEITLIATPESASFKNYTDEEPDPNKVIYTKMILDLEEFQDFTINQEADITFCLKELRAFLTFTEIGDCSLSLHFDDGGQPIIFSLSLIDSNLEADLVLSTIPNQNKTVPSKSTARGQNRNIVSNKRTETKTLQNKIPEKTVSRHKNNENNSNGNNIERIESRESTSMELPDNFLCEDSNSGIAPVTPPSKKFKSIFFDTPEKILPGQAEVILVPDTDDEDNSDE